MGGGLCISLTMHLHNEEKKKSLKKKRELDKKEARAVRDVESNKITLAVTEQSKVKSQQSMHSI